MKKLQLITLIIAWISLVGSEVSGNTLRIVVVDSVSGIPLNRASVFDKKGNTVGFSDSKGRLPVIPSKSFPITVSFVGFAEKTVLNAASDTVFLSEKTEELPEYVVKATRQKVLHVLAYVREYSTLSTYSDTVFMFREKMVDFMIVPDIKVKFKGWETPRVLTCRSYYRFTNSSGLDSVSDASTYHFSWCDWIGISGTRLPEELRNVREGSYTVEGRWRPTEIWSKKGENVKVSVNVLADNGARKWVPNLSGFFNDKLEFDSFHLRFNYDNVISDNISAFELTDYSFDISSTGRGLDLFRFNRPGQSFYVDTHGEVSVIDKEYISVKEARQWENLRLQTEEIGIYEPPGVAPLDDRLLKLIARVEEVDRESVRLDAVPDRKYVGTGEGRKNFKIGNRALFLLKQLTGVSFFKSRKNFKKKWDGFRDEQKARNAQRELGEM